MFAKAQKPDLRSLNPSGFILGLLLLETADALRPVSHLKKFSRGNYQTMNSARLFNIQSREPAIFHIPHNSRPSVPRNPRPGLSAGRRS